MRVRNLYKKCQYFVKELQPIMYMPYGIIILQHSYYDLLLHDRIDGGINMPSEENNKRLSSCRIGI